MQQEDLELCGGPVDSDVVSQERSSVADPGPPTRAAVPAPGARSDELVALLALAQKHANLGLPIDPSERFRPAKRLISRLCWIFLRHQVAFNQTIVQAVRELSEQALRMEQDMKDDLLDFADRSASQAQAELNDQVANARSAHAALVLELRTLQADLDVLLKRVEVAFPPEQASADVDERRDAIGNGGGPPGLR